MYRGAEQHIWTQMGAYRWKEVDKVQSSVDQHRAVINFMHPHGITFFRMGRNLPIVIVKKKIACGRLRFWNFQWNFGIVFFQTPDILEFPLEFLDFSSFFL